MLYINMELALPIIALGGLYIVSNQDKTEEKTKNNKVYERD